MEGGEEGDEGWEEEREEEERSSDPDPRRGPSTRTAALVTVVTGMFIHQQPSAVCKARLLFLDRTHSPDLASS